MKNLILALAFIQAVVFGQFVTLPKPAYKTANMDSVTGNAFTYIQPDSSKTVLRSMKMSQLAGYIGAAGCNTACQNAIADSLSKNGFSLLRADSIIAPYVNTPNLAPFNTEGIKFGIENGWHKDTAIASPFRTLSVVLNGPSTIAGGGVSDKYLLQNAVAENLKSAGFPVVSIVNAGAGGETIKYYRDNLMAGQLAANYDVIYHEWGVNEGAILRDSFLIIYDQVLAATRAIKTVQEQTIIISSPTATNDTPNGRDSVWYLSINSALRDLARKYQCVFNDTWTKYRIPYVGPWDDAYGDGRSIHPTDLLNMHRAGDIADAIADQDAARLLGSSKLHNTLSTAATVAASAAPNSTNGTGYLNYPSGLSMYRAQTGDGWANDGAVYSLKQMDGVSLQLNNQFSGKNLAYRSCGGTSCQEFQHILSADANGYVSAIGPGSLNWASGQTVVGDANGAVFYRIINANSGGSAYASWVLQNNVENYVELFAGSSAYNSTAGNYPNGAFLRNMNGPWVLIAGGATDADANAILDTNETVFKKPVVNMEDVENQADTYLPALADPTVELYLCITPVTGKLRARAVACGTP